MPQQLGHSHSILRMQQPLRQHISQHKTRWNSTHRCSCTHRHAQHISHRSKYWPWWELLRAVVSSTTTLVTFLCVILYMYMYMYTWHCAFFAFLFVYIWLAGSNSKLNILAGMAWYRRELELTLLRDHEAFSWLIVRVMINYIKLVFALTATTHDHVSLIKY